jgi:hypothetical protein
MMVRHPVFAEVQSSKVRLEEPYSIGRDMTVTILPRSFKRIAFEVTSGPKSQRANAE